MQTQRLAVGGKQGKATVYAEGNYGWFRMSTSGLGAGHPSQYKVTAKQARKPGKFRIKARERGFSLDRFVFVLGNAKPSDAQLDALTNNQLLRIPASNYVAFEAETYSKCVSCHRGKKGVNHGCASCMHPFCVCLDASLADFGVC